MIIAVVVAIVDGGDENNFGDHDKEEGDDGTVHFNARIEGILGSGRPRIIKTFL